MRGANRSNRRLLVTIRAIAFRRDRPRPRVSAVFTDRRMDLRGEFGEVHSAATCLFINPDETRAITSLSRRAQSLKQNQQIEQNLPSRAVSVSLAVATASKSPHQQPAPREPSIKQHESKRRNFGKRFHHAQPCKGLNRGACEHVDVDETARDRDCSDNWDRAKRDMGGSGIRPYRAFEHCRRDKRCPSSEDGRLCAATHGRTSNERR